MEIFPTKTTEAVGTCHARNGQIEPRWGQRCLSMLQMAACIFLRCDWLILDKRDS